MVPAYDGFDCHVALEIAKDTSKLVLYFYFIKEKSALSVTISDFTISTPGALLFFMGILAFREDTSDRVVQLALMSIWVS